MGRTAVLFEDNPTLSRALVLALVSRGYEVTVYQTGAECAQSLLTECPQAPGHPCFDLIMADIDIPGFPGLAFVEALREKGCKCRHIALMSAYWPSRTRSRSEELGCGVLTKPVFPGQLDGWLRQVERAEAAATAAPALPMAVSPT